MFYSVLGLYLRSPTLMEGSPSALPCLGRGGGGAQLPMLGFHPPVLWTGSAVVTLGATDEALHKPSRVLCMSGLSGPIPLSRALNPLQSLLWKVVFLFKCGSSLSLGPPGYFVLGFRLAHLQVVQESVYGSNVLGPDPQPIPQVASP